MRAAVLGSPVAHSLSPVLHDAAYRALGLDGWSYERVECDAGALPGFVARCGPEWAGLSVTMPGKRAALAVADEATVRARALGVANTLVRSPGGGWLADCTDVDGVAGALRAVGVRGFPGSGAAIGGFAVVGAGATANAAVGGLHQLGHEDVTLLVRDPARAADTLAVVEGYEMGGRAVVLGAPGDDDLRHVSALVNVTPAGAVDDALAARLVAGLPSWAVVLDAVYHPWPTPLAAAAHDRGLAVATGLDMLLHQGFGQVEQFTGRPAPRAAMHRALAEVTGVPLAPLPG